ncbi:putative solute-binding protein, partial [Oleiphilus sp. HI0128]
MSSRITRLFFFTLILVASALPANASNLTPVKFCVWDPVGANGPFISFLKETKLKAISWGIDLQMEAYTDEKVASNDFRSGECSAVLLTNILAKDFVPFTGAFGAPGAIRTLKELKTLSKSLSSKKAEKLISNGKYQMAGLFPIGE